MSKSEFGFSNNYTILHDRPKIEIKEDASFLEEVAFHDEHGDSVGYIRRLYCFNCGQITDEIQYRLVTYKYTMDYKHDSVGSREYPCFC